MLWVATFGTAGFRKELTPEAQSPRRTLLGDSLNKLVLCSLFAYLKAYGYTGRRKARPGHCACEKVSTALDSPRRAPATCPRQLWWELR